MDRSIAAVGSSKRRPGNYSFSAANVSTESCGISIDPILSIDHFEIRKPTFPPHPHAGFSAITYLFEDSEGEFINRDSLGGHLTVQPGSIIWNVTGSGVMHEEYPGKEGELSHGLQMFINLPSSEKLTSPHVMYVNGPDVPLYNKDSIKVRVLTGSFKEIKALISPPEKIEFLDVFLDSNTVFVKVIPKDLNVLIYVINGEIAVGNEEPILGEMKTAVLNFDGEHVQISTRNKIAHFILVSGKPLNEPIAMYGPFVMNNEIQLQQAFVRYRKGEMGHLVSTNNY